MLLDSILPPTIMPPLIFIERERALWITLTIRDR